jgi:hypothetical protein
LVEKNVNICRLGMGQRQLANEGMDFVHELAIIIRLGGMFVDCEMVKMRENLKFAPTIKISECGDKSGMKLEWKERIGQLTEKLLQK